MDRADLVMYVSYYIPLAWLASNRPSLGAKYYLDPICHILHILTTLWSLAQLENVCQLPPKGLLPLMCQHGLEEAVDILSAVLCSSGFGAGIIGDNLYVAAYERLLHLLEVAIYLTDSLP